MRRICIVTTFLLFSCVLFAQELPIGKGATELMVWAGGGSGLGHSDTTQVLDAGVRFGKVLTGPHGPGLLRGNLEYAFDVAPLYLFFQEHTVLKFPTCAPAPCLVAGQFVRERQTVYGGSVSPLIAKWNFTKGKRVVPYVAAEGSAIFTAQNVPADDTSQINFASGIAGGVQWLRGDRRAFNLSAHLMHISNASIGNHNPGVNITLQLRFGYQWWK